MPEQASISHGEQFLISRDLSTQIEEWLPLAEAGDADATYHLWRSYKECASGRSANEQAYVVDTLEQSNALPAKLDQSWAEYDRCQSVDRTKAIAEADRWADTLAELSHPVVESQQLDELADSEGLSAADEQALAILQSGNADAIINLASYIARRASQQLFIEPTSGRSLSAIENGIVMFACDLGAAVCQPNSRFMISLCGFEVNNCNPGLSLPDYIVEYELSVSDYDQALAVRGLAASLYVNQEYERILNIN